MMFRAVLLICLLAVSTLAWGERGYRWTDPVMRMDGSAFDPIKEIAEYRLYCGQSKHKPMVFIVAIPYGEHSYHYAGILSYCVLTVVDKNGQESNYSNVAGAPAPPIESIFK